MTRLTLLSNDVAYALAEVRLQRLDERPFSGFWHIPKSCKKFILLFISSERRIPWQWSYSDHSTVVSSSPVPVKSYFDWISVVYFMEKIVSLFTHRIGTHNINVLLLFLRGQIEWNAHFYLLCLKIASVTKLKKENQIRRLSSVCAASRIASAELRSHQISISISACLCLALGPNQCIDLSP